MLISPQMNTKLNEQITHEFGASQTYLAMACQFDNLGLKALSQFFRKQTEEERQHALKILDYVLDVGATVTLDALSAPASSHPTVLAAIETALAHEKVVTRQIYDLMELAIQERDHASVSFLKWFVDEQVEEVSSMERLAQVARLAGNDLLRFDAYVRHLLAGE